MEDQLDLPNPVLSYLVKNLYDEDLEVLCRVNWTLRNGILGVPIWKNRVESYIIKQGIAKRLEKITEYNLVRYSSHTESYHLIKRTRYINNRMVVHVPVHGIDNSNVVELEQEQDIKSFLNFQDTPSENVFYKTIYIRDLKASVKIILENILRPLIDFSENCVFRHDGIIVTNWSHCIKKETKYPCLRFTFEYTKYKELYKFLSIGEYTCL